MQAPPPPPAVKKAQARAIVARQGKTGLGIFSMGGRLVVSTVSGSAAKAGLQPGDRLLQVDGKAVGALPEAINLLKGQAGTKVQLMLERAGRPYEAVLERF